MIFTPRRSFYACVVAAIGAVCLSFPVLSRADQQDDISELMRRWKAASTAIVTARIKCYHFELGAHFPEDGDAPVELAVETSLTPDAFRVLFEKKLIPLVGSEDCFAAMERQIGAYIAETGKLDFVPSELSVVQDGETAKNDEQYKENHSLRLSTPEKFYSFDAGMNTAMVDDAGVRGDLYSAREMRFVLEGLPASVQQTLKLERLTSSTSRLAGSGVTVDFDHESAFISHFALANEATGRIMAEFWQAMPKRYAGGIELPTISARISYQPTRAGEAKLYDADIFVVTAAEFNQEIPASDLTLPVPKGAVMQDQTQPESPERRDRLLTAVDDVANLVTVAFPVRNSSPRQQESATESPPADRSWLVVVNVFTVVAICVFWVIRKRRSNRE